MNATARVIDCTASLDITQVGQICPQLLDALEAGGDVTLKGGDVERADTAGLQLLTAFVRDARSRGMRVGWDAPSQSLVRAASLLGLTGILGLPDH